MTERVPSGAWYRHHGIVVMPAELELAAYSLTTRRLWSMMKVDGDYLLETERVGLRPFRESDAHALSRVFADPYAARFYPDMSDLRKAEQWIARNRQRYATDGFGLWAACLKTTGELLGDCGLTYQTVEDRREVEIGYHLRAAARGDGLGTESALACLAYGFNELGCERLVSMVHPQNDASKRLAERVHMYSRRFVRQGDLYYLFYTERIDWDSRAAPA